MNDEIKYDTLPEEYKTLTFKCELGFMVERPYKWVLNYAGTVEKLELWDTHARSTNWAAIVSKDPRSPGGLSRRFLEKAAKESKYYYHVLDLKPFQPLEIATSYTNASGKKKTAYRLYCTVVTVSDSGLFVLSHDSAEDAIGYSEAIRNQGSSREPVESMLKQLEAEKLELERKLSEVTRQIKELSK